MEIGEIKDRLPHLNRVEAFLLHPYSPQRGENPVAGSGAREYARIGEVHRIKHLSTLTYYPLFRIFDTLESDFLSMFIRVQKPERGFSIT